jgi:hypothetical protein
MWPTNSRRLRHPGGERHRGHRVGITNAIFHATGKRIRELPVTPDKLL